MNLQLRTKLYNAGLSIISIYICYATTDYPRISNKLNNYYIKNKHNSIRKLSFDISEDNKKLT